MIKKKIQIEVYGAEQVCASCVNLPSSKDTYEWLEAALTRKFPNQPFSIAYIDMFNPPEMDKQKNFAARMIEEDLFYPLVIIEDEIVAEGSVSLKKIVDIMKNNGYESN
ncbi:YuzD family protein [Peribacillus sp. NPDC097675]|uniref:YuzD family protein n=1 Tax=Peribacillus sp. NPDC097675 TaxID=3390618 RepID=UPI003D04B675